MNNLPKIFLVLILENNNTKISIIPLVFPWKDINNKTLNFFQIYYSRFFTIKFLIIIWLIWFFLGDMSNHNCITPSEKIGCYAAIWHENIIHPVNYLISFITAPFFYNSTQHITFTTISFLIFVQSFEARVGTIRTIIIFYVTIISISIIGGIISNLGSLIFPEVEIFSYMLERSWMGSSSGFMGIIGAMAHFSKFKPTLPSIVILFELWNLTINGISLSISITHASSCLFGYLLWEGVYNRKYFGLLQKLGL